ncbi:WD40 repeat-like protein [Exidia glandulosa HHB12029]|uniref:WD40 repeat-like protein n=1 Tax=Exidia glandulosa HHB12029 TaxID=1314781 RepID=A0A165ZA24_EXIGL|nr:WD40 repeat-like protein [Exidia glandulosa HHB12029]
MRQNYSCDTIPPPQNPARREELVDAPGSADAVASAQFEVPQDDEEAQVDSEERQPAAQSARPQPPARKLCVRHQRMADEGTIVKLQSSLDALPVEERETVSTIWSTFSSSSHPRRELILRGILTMCCFSQLSLLSEQLINLIRVDPFSRFPREVSLKVLRHLDAISLGRAAQVNRHWRSLADDNVLWKSICEQHIDKQCRKCGWGLPLLEKRRAAPASSTPRPTMPLSPAASSSSLAGDSLKRAHYDEEHEHEHEHEHPAKRHKSDSPPPSSSRMSVSPIRRSPTPPASGPSGALSPSSVSTQRPWKDIYCERLTIARNWRRGRYSVRTLKGHGDSVMCLQFNEAMRGVNYPMLITGSYDRTVRVWNVDAGEEVQCLRGHTRAVRALQFDEAKLITGSMDCTLRVWDWRTGRCIRTLQGHSEGVVCLKFDSNVLASGSVDTTVKVWNFRTGECFTLRGHKDWVNAVQLWQLPGTEVCSSVSSAADGTFDIDPGKMLFSASDDCTIRLWDLSRKCCVRQFVGHVGQVQSLLLLNIADCPPAQQDDDGEHHPGGAVRVASASNEDSLVPPGTRLPHLISGSLDNTIKTWDIETGLATQTLFGHIEGVWSVVGDSLRLASGSHDKTIKVWQREESAPPLNLVGHEGPVTCLQLSDDKIISGSDDHTIKVWSFSA